MVGPNLPRFEIWRFYRTYSKEATANTETAKRDSKCVALFLKLLKGAGRVIYHTPRWLVALGWRWSRYLYQRTILETGVVGPQWSSVNIALSRSMNLICLDRMKVTVLPLWYVLTGITKCTNIPWVTLGMKWPLCGYQLQIILRSVTYCDLKLLTSYKSFIGSISQCWTRPQDGSGSDQEGSDWSRWSGVHDSNFNNT